jgi:hypothetical protein
MLIDQPDVQQAISLLASMISLIVGIVVVGIYFQVRDASKVCRRALELL